MGRIVRLTERDLTRLVKRVINESRIISEGQMSQQQLTSGLSDGAHCFKSKNMPITYKLAGGNWDTAYAFLLMSLGVGHGIIKSLTGVYMDDKEPSLSDMKSNIQKSNNFNKGYNTGKKGVDTIYKTNYNQISTELSKLKTCVFGLNSL